MREIFVQPLNWSLTPLNKSLRYKESPRIKRAFLFS
nr:MAG TPA: hypothetical protein [Bacteriophage sp.]